MIGNLRLLLKSISTKQNMMAEIIDNLNIETNEALVTPQELKNEMPLAGPALESLSLIHI